jgi:hypothetical protein
MRRMVVCVVEVKNSYILVAKLKGRGTLGDLGVNERIISEWILKT